MSIPFHHHLPGSSSTSVLLQHHSNSGLIHTSISCWSGSLCWLHFSAHGVCYSWSAYCTSPLLNKHRPSAVHLILAFCHGPKLAWNPLLHPSLVKLVVPPLQTPAACLHSFSSAAPQRWMSWQQTSELQASSASRATLRHTSSDDTSRLPVAWFIQGLFIFQVWTKLCCLLSS